MKKRLLSLLLVLVMVLGMMPLSAFAAESEAAEDSVTVYFSISSDAEYLTGDATGEVMALKEITVPYFDLALYGLEGFYFSSESYGDDGDGQPGSDLAPGTAEYAEGKVTLLHLYIYALERYYCGLEEEEAGQGYLYDEGLLGTEVLDVGGSQGSAFLNYIWGVDMNLNYYVNYEYPLASEGWGATCDQILLRDGDIMTLGHFSGWSFYNDPTSIFNYMTADDENPTQGDEVTLTLYHAGADFGGTYTTAHTVVDYCPEVFYAPVDDIPSGNVTEWTYLGTVEADGTLVVDTTDLEPGEYIIAMAGQYGVDYPDDICSTPGGIRLTVEAADDIAVTGVTLDQEAVELEIGETAVLTAAVTPEDATDKTVAWFSSDESVAAVADGVVTAVAAGEATITATAGGVSATCSVTVQAAAEPFTYSITDTPSNGNNWAKLGNGTISGEVGGVSQHIWDGSSLTVLLTEDTPDDAVITSSFATSGLGPSVSGTGDVTLENGTATQTITLSSPFGTVGTWNVIYTKDQAPVLAEGQAAAASGEMVVNESYEVPLDGIFADADGDALTYLVSVDGGANEAVDDSSYVYTPTVPGEHTLTFTANDGVLNSGDTYTVTVTVKNSSVTYDVTVTVPEGVEPAFYAVNEVVDGEAIKGDALIYENGIVKVPENIGRIAWEADGAIGMSAPVSADAALEIVTVTFEATLYSGEADTEAAVKVEDAEGVSVTGTAGDTYLLPAVEGFTYQVSASADNASKYYPGELTEQTPAAGEVKIALSIKHFTVIAPEGSVVSAGTLSGSFAYSFAEPIDTKNVDDTVVYLFAPLSGNAFIRVQNPDDDAVTYWDYKSSKADGQTITVTREMLFMDDAGTEGEFNSDTVYRNFEYYSFDLGDIYMNINNQGYINLEVGDVKNLNMFRNFQAINSYTNDKIAVPDFEYEIVNLEGDQVISIDPDKNNTGAATLTAKGEGTAIVLVTYDAMYSELTATGTLGGQGGGNRLSAIWPDRTGVFVVSVGKDGTSINSNMTCNGAVFDAEHSPQFYHGDEGASVSFVPDEGVTVTVNRSTVGEEKLSFGEFTDEGVSVDAETGEVTVSGLTTGRHIIRLEKDGVAAYQVVTATKTTVTMTNSEGEEISLDEKLEPGETVNITIKGLTNPAEKFATKYNFNAQITYQDQAGNPYSNSSGAYYGRYDFSSLPQTVTVTIPEDWSEDKLILNGYIKMGGFAGDGIGSHRKVNYGVSSGMAWGTDAGMELGTLPEIVLNVALPHEHSYEAVVTAPTCTEDGYTTYTCACGDSYVADETAALGHTEVVDEAVEATCTATGLTEGKHCSVCDEVLVAQIEVAALGHSYEYGICTVCHEQAADSQDSRFSIHINADSVKAGEAFTVTVRMDEAIALSGNITNVQGEIYCDSELFTYVSHEMSDAYAHYMNGYVEKWGRFQFSNTSMTNTPYEVPAGEVLTLTYKANEDISAAHFMAGFQLNIKISTQAAVTVESDAYDFVMVTNSHTWDEGVITADPTCGAEGIKTYTCTYDGCGATMTEPVAATGAHTEVVDAAVAATCTTAGKTEGKHCSVCGEILVAQTEVAALGHSYGEWIVNMEATCTEAGEKTRTCGTCGDTETQTIPVISCPSEAFADLNTAAWYHEGVDFVLTKGLMNGVSAAKFDPDGDLTRAQLVMILYRMEGSPSVDGLDNPFKDVPADAWFADAVIWAANKGVVNGVSPTSFAPDMSITREQIATMLYRYAGGAAVEEDHLSGFDDADAVGAYAVDALNWAVANGLIQGVTDSTIVPGATATRAQIATILMRYCRK